MNGTGFHRDLQGEQRPPKGKRTKKYQERGGREQASEGTSKVRLGVWGEGFVSLGNLCSSVHFAVPFACNAQVQQFEYSFSAGRGL